MSSSQSMEAIPFFDETEETPLDSFALMKHVLTTAHSEGIKARFTCPLGMGHVFMQRVRMRISRLRKDLKKEGKTLVRFRLTADVKSDKEKGEDLVVIERVMYKHNDLEMALDKLNLDEGLENGFSY